MEKDEIVALLNRHEWNDLEFKKGQKGVPAETYKTVSAFSNTKGGWILFGVKDEDGLLEVVGVLDVDSVQNDFLGVLRSRSKLNQVISAEEDLVMYEDKVILAFYIPELPRHKKPVFLNGNWSECYVRSGGCNQKCTEEEIRRFIRDSSDVSYDSEPVPDIDSYHFYDEESLQYYRNLYNSKGPGRDKALNNIDFLSKFGFLVEKNGNLLPTRAGVLIFGKDMYVRRILNNRIVVDYQRIDLDYDKWSPEIRWHDRVVIEGNLIQAWLILAEKYHRMAERPFSIDKLSLRRNDEPADYIAFREAAINLLIHQDYGDYGRKASIKFYKDRTIFWNPGDSYADEKELLETTEKEVRNPAIVSAFRRIGMSEQAGSGVPSIFNNWRELGNVPPIIHNIKDKKAFELILLKDKLLSHEQSMLLKEAGLNLSEEEGRIFALFVRNNRISLTDVRAVTGKKWHECREIISGLIHLGLIRSLEDNWFEPALRLIDSGIIERLREEASGKGISKIKAGDSDTFEEEILSDLEYEVLIACEFPRATKELLDITPVKSIRYLRKAGMNPLIKREMITMTNPQNPTSPKQKYIITDKGKKYLYKNKR